MSGRKLAQQNLARRCIYWLFQMQLRGLAKVAGGLIRRVGAPYQPSRTCDKGKQKKSRTAHGKQLDWFDN